MVGGCGVSFEELDAAVGVGCGGGDDGGELFERDVVGAGVGDEGSAGAEEADGAEVELFVAAECALGGAFRLGEGGWVEDDGVEFLGIAVEVAEVVEGVGFDPVGLGG